LVRGSVLYRRVELRGAESERGDARPEGEYREEDFT